VHATSELDHVWVQIAETLRERIGERTFERWLAPLRCVARDGGALALEGPREVSAWAASRLGPAIADAAAARLGHDVAITINGRPLQPAATAPARSPARAEPTHLNPRYTFEQFVIGPSNRLAHAAALSVAEMPSQAYNPLFIYGPPGLGKTHLLHSVGNYVNAFGGGLVVRYATAEEFTNGFLAALRSRSLEDFKSRFRGADVLLVDDVQFLERKARSEEELFHTFNALYDAGSQLVITCDRLPSDLGELEDRLRERFAAGLVTDIERPDLATRLAIVRKRAAHGGIALSMAASQLLAERITTNVRALEGALIRLVAYGSLTGRDLDGDLTTDVLDRLGVVAEAQRAPSVREIQDAACSYFGLARTELLSRSRTARVVWARHAAMYLAKELTDHSLPKIASEFGGRDHTTVINACRRVAVRIAESREHYTDIDALTALVVTHRATQ
jgi:chromosomal replication initiator protein